LKQKLCFDIYFGVPGAGKTTIAAALTKKHVRKKIPVYSNVPITGAYKLEPHLDIGRYMLEKCLIIIDEAGIDYNNRSYKNLSQEEIRYFKYHRHYKASVVIFSQSYDDMDITLRRLAQRYYVVKRSIIPFVVLRKTIGRKVGINETTHDIQDQYFFKPLGTKRYFAPRYWKYFNTYSHKTLPIKEWGKW